METIKWIMALSFVGASALMMFKLYHFFNTRVEGFDEHAPEAVAELHALLEALLCEQMHLQSAKALYEAFITHERFDAARFVHFNENRLRLMLASYALSDPDLDSIGAIRDHLLRS